MSGAALPKLGPKAREIVDAVLRDGIYRALKESDTAVCRNLNSRQFLGRDKKDGAVWYPTAKLCELAGVTPPEIGQGGRGRTRRAEFSGSTRGGRRSPPCAGRGGIRTRADPYSARQD